MKSQRWICDTSNISFYKCVCVCVQAEALQGLLDEADSSAGLSVEKKASVIPRVRTLWHDVIYLFF